MFRALTPQSPQLPGLSLSPVMVVSLPPGWPRVAMSLFPGLTWAGYSKSREGACFWRFPHPCPQKGDPTPAYRGVCHGLSSWKSEAWGPAAARGILVSRFLT